jgi:Flp pilus assembly protein TadG
VHGRDTGSALVEFTFIVPVFMLLSLGVINFALVIEQGIAVSAAAHAGAEYGAVEGNQNNLVGMQTAASVSTNAVTIAAVASTWCTCSVNSSLVVACTSTCNTYDQPVQYVQVKTTATVPVLIPYTGLPVNVKLAGSSILRAR